ncbi:hypothetical protein B0H13DRAFT_1912109 [Mycena leptocephala]|nr:hypothetical protein B0H13DRAFT_1912109 [Mycena leptocephala]
MSQGGVEPLPPQDFHIRIRGNPPRFTSLQEGHSYSGAETVFLTPPPFTIIDVRRGDRPQGLVLIQLVCFMDESNLTNYGSGPRGVWLFQPCSSEVPSAGSALFAPSCLGQQSQIPRRLRRPHSPHNGSSTPRLPFPPPPFNFWPSGLPRNRLHGTAPAHLLSLHPAKMSADLRRNARLLKVSTIIMTLTRGINPYLATPASAIIIGAKLKPEIKKPERRWLLNQCLGRQIVGVKSLTYLSALHADSDRMKNPRAS